jgi:hypothetical protein
MSHFDWGSAYFCEASRDSGLFPLLLHGSSMKNAIKELNVQILGRLREDPV